MRVVAADLLSRVGSWPLVAGRAGADAAVMRRIALAGVIAAP